MYAIVEISGKQFKVAEKDRIYVPLQDAEVNKTVSFERVLLVSNDDKVQVGTPILDGAVVKAKVVEHVKADKVLVFRKKRRKRFKVKRGHRQPYTQIEVSSIKTK
ncbi:MAG: 50S ribosomal protein L21 [Rhodothermales bacterium]|nr:50S ribosomal protein L21 [Rhodothermales bacterium]